MWCNVTLLYLTHKFSDSSLNAKPGWIKLVRSTEHHGGSHCLNTPRAWGAGFVEIKMTTGKELASTHQRGSTSVPGARLFEYKSWLFQFSRASHLNAPRSSSPARGSSRGSDELINVKPLERSLAWGGRHTC